MSTRAPFMNTAYSGYYHRDVPKENEELTHVGPNTPCGEYLRRFWQPLDTLLGKPHRSSAQRVRDRLCQLYVNSQLRTIQLLLCTEWLWVSTNK